MQLAPNNWFENKNHNELAPHTFAIIPEIGTHITYTLIQTVRLCIPWSPILSLQPRKVKNCSRHVMAFVWNINITETLLILCLAYYVMSEFDNPEIEALWLSRIEIWVRVSQAHSPHFP